MQTPAEKYLIERVIEILKSNDSGSGENKILNVGAGERLVLEKSIHNGFGKKFICDRMDIVDCYVKYPFIGKCFIASVESMPEIKSSEYEIAFANYVLEHVTDLHKAASEIHRILKPSGYFITSLSNPIAPEFVLSKRTPTKFHQIIKGKGEGSHAYETQYAFKNIIELVLIFKKHFSVIEIKYRSNTLGYLYRFPIINIISKIYDKIVNYFNIKMLMGDVFVIFKK